MANKVMPHLSLAKAKQLVALLEDGQVNDANQIIESIDCSVTGKQRLFSEVGELTRDVHEALVNLNNDTRLLDIADQDLPDAKIRLNHVIEMTDKAANSTMDAIDYCLPLAEQFINDLDTLMPDWKNLMDRNLEINDFKKLCHSVDSLFTLSQGNIDQLRIKLTEILLAQEFQDLTGQIINKVIELVQEIETKLVVILRVCAKQDNSHDISTSTKKLEAKPQRDIKAEGPSINTESRADVVNDQDDVDELLLSLGF